MKKFTLIAAVLFMAFAAKAQDVASSATSAVAEKKVMDIKDVVEFKNADYDFGKIPYGKATEYELDMKNISKDTLRIENVQVGCGCTTPKWQPGPYKAGENFKIMLGFNGYTKGAFQKSVTLFFSGGLSKSITFKGETFEVPETPAPANAPIQKMKEATGN